MRHRNTENSWGSITRALHWLMALLLVLQAGLGFVADELSRSPLKVDVMTAHKSLGISLLLLVLIRLAWRWFSPTPGLPAKTGKLTAIAAHASHGLIYILLIAVPVSGWLVASTSIIPWKLWWVIPWPRLASPDQELNALASDLHEGAFVALCVLVAVHIAAALKHHFVDRDDVLRRMWREQ